MMQPVDKKPGRPLGVTIAVVASILVFSVLPLLRVAVILAVEQRFASLSDVNVPLGDEEIAPFASGGDFGSGLTDAEIVFQVMVSAGFLVLAFFAWRGGSQVMRFVFTTAVVLLALLTIGVEVTAILSTEGRGASGGSLDALFDAISSTALLLRVLVPVYVVWYLNRGPARAFYRGYYLEREERAASL